MLTFRVEEPPTNRKIYSPGGKKMTDCSESKLLQCIQLLEKKIPHFLDQYLLYFSVHENVHVFM